jgi:hypothetical protein
MISYQTNGQMRRIAPAVWGVWHHAITTIAFYTRGHSTRQRVRDCNLKELAMPDLDQIKQGEQELGTSAGGSPGVGRAIPRAARSPRPRQPRCPAIARRRGRGADPQSRRAGARRRPAALRLCLERIVGPIVSARSNSRCRQSATSPIWRGQKGKADPTEAGKMRTLRWSREYTPVLKSPRSRCIVLARNKAVPDDRQYRTLPRRKPGSISGRHDQRTDGSRLSPRNLSVG